MFAYITTGSAGEALDANPWAPLTLVHVHASGNPDRDDIDWVINHLDEPALPRADFHEKQPDATVWHITIAAIPDMDQLDDAECTAIVREVAAAAGFHQSEKTVTRWAALRSHQEQTLHVVASTVGEDGKPFQVNPDRVHLACRDISARMYAQNRMSFHVMDDFDHLSVVIRDDPHLGVAHAVGADDLVALVLRRSGFRPAALGGYSQVWRTPYGADAHQRAHIASTALGVLSVADYRVDIHSSLLTRPWPDHDIGQAERRITDLTEQLGFSFNADETADITAEINAALQQAELFTNALGRWATRVLGDDTYSDRLAHAAGLLNQAADIINRDPGEAPAPRPHHMVTRAATTRTTTWVNRKTPTAPTPPPSSPPPPPARPAR